MTLETVRYEASASSARLWWNQYVCEEGVVKKELSLSSLVTIKCGKGRNEECTVKECLFIKEQVQLIPVRG